MLVVFGIVVPTGDNYSDIVTSYRFFTGNYIPAGTLYYGAHPTTGIHGEYPIESEPQIIFVILRE